MKGATQIKLSHVQVLLITADEQIRKWNFIKHLIYTDIYCFDVVSPFYFKKLWLIERTVFLTGVIVTFWKFSQVWQEIS